MVGEKRFVRGVGQKRGQWDATKPLIHNPLSHRPTCPTEYARIRNEPDTNGGPQTLTRAKSSGTGGTVGQSFSCQTLGFVPLARFVPLVSGTWLIKEHGGNAKSDFCCPVRKP